MTELPEFQDVIDAADRLSSLAVTTPIIESGILNQLAGGRVILKAENLQRTGSFKFRGAYNCISRIDRKEFPGGVVACSSGNHAQGVAEAARLCGLKSAIVMPEDAPKIKIARTRRSGAEIVPYDRLNENREKIAEELTIKRKAKFVAPYDNEHIIAGQGTVGLELLQQAHQAGVQVGMILIPCGGGGLSSGIGLVAKSLEPEIELYTVEPEGFDDTARSLRHGRRERNSRMTGSICDALLAPEPGELTFELNKNQLSGGLAVTDDAVCRAVKFAFEELKLVVEPGGAVGLAAILQKQIKVNGRDAAIILSGGNVDLNFFAERL